MRICVTGATGFVGGHLCEGFRDAGWEVTGLVRQGSSKPLPAGVSRLEAGLSATDLAVAFAGSSLVVHAAGVTRARHESVFQEINVKATDAVVKAVNASKSHLIFISSQAAAGPGTPERPAREDDRPRPLTAYGRSKLAAEEAIRANARNRWTVLRPSSIYGPRDLQFLPMFKMARRGLFPLASASASYTLVHVDDVVRAAIAAAADNRATGQVFFVGHPQPVTTTTLLDAIGVAVGRGCHPTPVPRVAMQLLAAAGELSWKLGRQPLVDRARLTELYAEGFVCSVEKLRTCLGVEANVGLQDGITQTAEWYRREGWI